MRNAVMLHVGRLSKVIPFAIKVLEIRPSLLKLTIATVQEINTAENRWSIDDEDSERMRKWSDLKLIVPEWRRS
jgi:hypothetical protein